MLQKKLIKKEDLIKNNTHISISGIFGFYKKIGISSFEVISLLRMITGVKKIGHAGTLDPLAEGVLVVALGKDNTKLINQFMNQEKEYIAEFTLGVISDTDDGEGPLTSQILSSNFKIPTRDIIENHLNKFIGEIFQRPPIFSAIKVDGYRAYDLARDKKIDTLPPRKVDIKSIEIISYNYPTLKVKIICGKGVYIRSIARDLGESLTCGAYMSHLLRSRVGEFTLDNCLYINF